MRVPRWALWVLLFLFIAMQTTVLLAAPPSFTISWTAPTQFTDGSAISGPITYQVYAGLSGKEVAIGRTVSAPPYILLPTPPAGTSECVQVTAIVAGVESTRPPEVCATVPFPLPNSPSIITIVIH